MSTSFKCSRCGRIHESVPAFAFKFPIDYMDVPEPERAARVFLSDDTCVIDDARFFVRGCLEIPVHDSCSPLVWVVWVAVEEEDFYKFQDLLDVDVRSQSAPFEGQLSSPPRPYPDTTHLRAVVRLRDHGTRPLVEVEMSDHPLFVEQRDGISQARLAEIVELMKPRAKRSETPEP